MRGQYSTLKVEEEQWGAAQQVDDLAELCGRELRGATFVRSVSAENDGIAARHGACDGDSGATFAMVPSFKRHLTHPLSPPVTVAELPSCTPLPMVTRAPVLKCNLGLTCFVWGLVGETSS